MQIERLLLPLRGDPVDEEAAILASDLLRSAHGRVYALYVISVPWEYPVDAELPTETAKGEEALRRVEQLLHDRKCEVTAELLQARDVGAAVVAEAMEREVDLVLLGMAYKRRHGIFSMGDEVPYILKNAPCPVLVLREPMPSEAAATEDSEAAVSGGKTP